MKSFKYFLLLLILLGDIATACSRSSQKHIKVLNSEVLKSEVHQWIITSVEIREDCTIVEKCVRSLENERTWVMSTPDEYISDVSTGEMYRIRESEIGFERHKVFLEGYKEMSFKEIYPPLPPDVNFVHISSGTDFFLRYLDLNSECSPAKPPRSDMSFSGVCLGARSREAAKALKKHGYEQFYSEEEEDVLGGYDIYSYFQGSEDDYAVTVEVEISKEFDIVEGIEVLYQNHVDMYEVEEHLQEIVDEIKATYQYRKWEESTPSYRGATSMITLKSGKDRIFKNVTIKKFSGHYRLYASRYSEEDEFFGTISIDVHDDNMHQDLVISVRYDDRDVSNYVRRSAGKVKW